MSPLAAIVMLTLADAPPETLTVLPRAAAPPIKVEPFVGGYTLRLDRATAEKMRDSLMSVENPQTVADAFKGSIDPERRPEMAATVRSAALVFGSQAVPLREALRDKMGERGVLITVYGLPKTQRKERPVLKAIIRAAAPEEVADAMRDFKLMMDTNALYWRAEPIGDKP